MARVTPGLPAQARGDSRTKCQAYLLLSPHLTYALFASALYAALYAVTLLIEIAYQFDRYGRTGIKVSVAAFSWIFLSSMAGLALDGWRVWSRQLNGLILSCATFFGSALALFVGLSFFLPASPVTQSLLQSYPAQAAYLKDTTYSLLLVLLFLLIPFHFVLAVHNEITWTNHFAVRDLLAGTKSGAAPEGTIYIRPWALSSFLVVLAALSLYLTTNLLDHIKPSPYMNLFTNLIYVRLILYFGLGLLSLIWYYRTLNDIKRQALPTPLDTPRGNPRSIF